MSEEEKKAIEDLKKLKELKLYFTAQFFSSGEVTLDEENKAIIDTILNLIEKQAKEIKELTISNKELDKECSRLEQKEVEMEKEIEELKYKVKEHICIEAHEQVKQCYIPKQKIKDKIEEIKKIDRAYDEYWNAQLDVLQELLEG